MGGRLTGGILRRREARSVIGAATISLLGDGIAPVALTFGVLDLTGSATVLGLVLAARSLALIISLPFGGVLADRVSRRQVMLCADLVRFAAQAAVGVLVISAQAGPVEFVVSQIVIGASSGFFNPASSGLLPSVAGSQLREANALLGMSAAAGNVLGPAIAALLILAGGSGFALIVDAATYAASASWLLGVKSTRSTQTASRSNYASELRDGFTEFTRRRWVWLGVAVFAFVNMAASAFPVLGAVVVRRDLGGAAAWAAVLAVRGLGGVLGGLALVRFSPTRPLLVAVIACAATPLPTLLLAVPAPLFFILPLALAAGVGPTVAPALWLTTLQTHVPKTALSRVMAYDWLGSSALVPAGYALVGPASEALGTSGALIVCGSAELLLLASLLTLREFRAVPREPGPSG